MNHLLPLNGMCGSIKNPYPPHGRSMEIPRRRGGGVLKAKFLEEMYENKLEFPGRRGGGVQNQKTLRGGSMDIFGNCTMLVQCKVTPCPTPGILLGFTGTHSTCVLYTWVAQQMA